MTKNLTEKQQKFLAALFDEAGGDARLAKKMAGYSDETRLSEVVKPLKDEIMEATKEYMLTLHQRQQWQWVMHLLIRQS